jgi:hypothetical protein
VPRPIHAAISMANELSQASPRAGVARSASKAEAPGREPPCQRAQRLTAARVWRQAPASGEPLHAGASAKTSSGTALAIAL